MMIGDYQTIRTHDDAGTKRILNPFTLPVAGLKLITEKSTEKRIVE
tara:strand:+ start:288 stop:425 length:138 start_codon:yes stop_codon:yes gene_type:complete